MIRNKTPVFAGARVKNGAVKAYNMAILDDDNAEINMYGEVVPIVPKDWRNGERLPGYIGLDEFLEDLENIKDKGNITVHINSGGGDLYAGLAIYNRLKDVKGTVTTINDGMAASAASLIFQAGNVRKMNAGSNLMAHGVAGFLFGYYGVEDLKSLVTEFKAHNRAIVNVYAERMGVTYDEAKSFVDGETWLTGQQAVDKGLADEVIGGEEAEEDEDGLLDRLMARLRASYGGMSINPAAAIAAGANPYPAAPAPMKDKTNNERSTDMEIKNLEELRAAFPDLLAQAETAAREEGRAAGVAEERARIQGIEAIENAVADKSLLNAAKFGDAPLTAEQLALQAMQAQAAVGAAVLNDMAADAGASGAAGVPAAPNAGPEADEDGGEDIQAEIKQAVELANTMRNGGKQ